MKKQFLLFFFALSTLGAFSQATIQMALPGQTSTYSTDVRGYWFTAPTCFTITGLEVPTDASAGTQNIAVVRLYNNPPQYDTTTNVFTTLFLTQNNASAGMIPVSIQVEQGDIIGILGNRADNNSYTTGPVAAAINGFPVSLIRLGMQYSLSSTAPQELFTELSGNISRVWMYYDSVLYYNIGTNITDNTVEFTNGSDSSFTSVWDFGDGSALQTEWAPTHTYSSIGTYDVCSYITNSCGTDTVCTTVVITTLGIAGQTANTDVRVYPNPVTSNAVFSVQSEQESGNYFVDLTDIHGNLITTVSGRFNEDLTLDCTPFASGLYFYKIRKGQIPLNYGKLIVK